MTDRLQQKAREIAEREFCKLQRWNYPFTKVHQGENDLTEYSGYQATLAGALAGLTAGIAMAAEACEEPIKFAGGPSPSTKQAWRDCAYAIRALAKGQTQ